MGNEQHGSTVVAADDAKAVEGLSHGEGVLGIGEEADFVDDYRLWFFVGNFLCDELEFLIGSGVVIAR